MAPYDMILRNGFRVTMQKSGNQTLLKVFNEAGELVKTRLKSVVHSTIPPQAAKETLGFVKTAPQQAKGKIKDIFTITKNDFDHIDEVSRASVLDRVYINGERVGERLRSAMGEVEGEPMNAMKQLKGEWVDGEDNLVQKVLSYFHDGIIQKSTRTDFVRGIRRSRKNIDVTDLAFGQEYGKICKKYHGKNHNYNVQIRNYRKELKKLVPGESTDPRRNEIKSELRRLLKERLSYRKEANLEAKSRYDFYRNRSREMMENGEFRPIEFDGAKLRADVDGIDFTL